ncbi:uncharacterized protein LOC112181497 isoform X3 [Rosa chinensis]|nr:uncharacterized protein LOC112181497 isoform X3 [Rosa chinensis]XP_040372173.1 uncharacterized protein LOC112181497 isoform X3 [Rosa chinensis]XP_040372176.1 uncharacterized protein LOC112181497 isoform X3 [Rosa chinensis]
MGLRKLINHQKWRQSYIFLASLVLGFACVIHQVQEASKYKVLRSFTSQALKTSRMHSISCVTYEARFLCFSNSVDMRKANMDFLHPGTANRVTELPGFKDEVLINFIHGLLDVKVLTLEEPERGLTIVKLTHVDVPEEDSAQYFSGSPSHPTANEASTNTKENFQADELMDDMMKISCNDWFEL